MRVTTLCPCVRVKLAPAQADARVVSGIFPLYHIL